MYRPRNRSRQPRFRFVIPARFFRWALTSLTVFAVFWSVYTGYQWMSNPNNLPFKHVVIRAPFLHVPKKQLELSMAPHLKKNFVTLDVVQLQQALRQVPWVKNIQVRRIWPDTLLVTVIEQLPVARWAAGGAVNIEGELFRVDTRSLPAGLPEFSGPADMAKSMLTHYREFQKTLNAEALKITTLSVNPRHAWELQLEGGTVIKLGQAQHQERLDLVVKAWPTLTQGHTKQLRTVDARYANGIAVAAVK